MCVTSPHLFMFSALHTNKKSTIITALYSEIDLRKQFLCNIPRKSRLQNSKYRIRLLSVVQYMLHVLQDVYSIVISHLAIAQKLTKLNEGL